MSLPTPLREPRAGAFYAEVSAPRPQPWPRSVRSLEPRISGAGRDLGLEEFLETTSTTALVVVVDGVLVHERYVGTTTADDRLLGNSATKSALATLTGMAVRTGKVPDL